MWNDPRFSGFDAPIDQIWVSPDRKYTRLLDLGKAPNLWMAADQRKGLIHGSFDVSCTLPAVFVKVIEDVTQIVPRTRRIADLHRPWRFQSASISASGTNSPRRACSRPSRMAARVSSSIGSICESSRVIDNSMTATESCSSSGSSRAFEGLFEQLGHLSPFNWPRIYHRKPAATTRRSPARHQPSLVSDNQPGPRMTDLDMKMKPAVLGVFI